MTFTEAEQGSQLACSSARQQPLVRLTGKRLHTGRSWARTPKLESTELRATRRELQLKLKNTVDLFREIVSADMEDERTTATIRTLPRKKKESSA